MSATATRSGRRSPRSRAQGWPARLGAATAVLVVILAVVGLDRLNGATASPSFDALPAVARTIAAAVLLFGLCGYPLARAALPARLQDDWPLFALPVGAMASALGLTLLGFARLPLELSLAAILLAAAVGAWVVHRRTRPLQEARTPQARRDLRGPLVLGALITAVAVAPLFQPDGFATVLGQNGDGHMSTGAATLLQHTHPTGEDTALPVDRMPGSWGSKYPIYYSLAAVSTLAGLESFEAFATLSALLVALTALGFLLLARHMLGAGVAGGLAAMALIGFNEQVLHLALNPFYNQLWGTLALPFTLLAGWLYIREPSRGSLLALTLFGLVGSFAYPLLAPFTALFVLVVAALTWRDRRAEGRRPGWVAALHLPRGHRWLSLWVPLALATIPVVVALSLEGGEKVVSGIRAVLPGGDLGPWSGEGLAYLALGRSLGTSELPLVAWLLLAAAGFALVQRPRAVAVPIGVATGVLLLVAGYTRLLSGGQLFEFKALSFGGVLVVGLAGVGLAEAAVRPRGPLRVAAAVGIGLVLVASTLSARGEIRRAQPHLTSQLADLRDWSSRLPAGRSVRVDVTPIGMQQWAWYMMADRPLTAADPLLLFFPYAPKGRKADYLVVNRAIGRPPGAAGAALHSNRDYALYEMRPDAPGPDVSSRAMIDPFVYEHQFRPGAR